MSPIKLCFFHALPAPRIKKNGQKSFGKGVNHAPPPHDTFLSIDVIPKDLETIKSQTGQINNRLNTNQTVELNESDKVKDLERALSLESSKVKVLDEELRAKKEQIEELVRNKTAGKEELERLKVILIFFLYCSGH